MTIEDMTEERDKGKDKQGAGQTLQPPTGPFLPRRFSGAAVRGVHGGVLDRVSGHRKE